MIFKDDSLGKLRLVVLENIPWFNATDIAKILDYSRMKNFLLHVKQENMQLVSNSKCDLGFIEPKSTLINKDGLFEALDKMTGVRSQVADRLKKWIEREILPSVEKQEKPLAVVEKNCEDSDMNVNGLEVFYSEEFGTLRTIEVNNEPWFLGKDVADMLGYNNSRDALFKHVDSEDKNTVAIRDGIAGNPNQTVINESGVYALVFSSKLPTAKKFKRWVTSEVLPTIRKTGSYQKPMSQLEILQGSIQKLVEQEREIARIKLTQQEQAENLQAVSKRIDTLNGVCIDGTKRQQLVAMVNGYANKAGFSYAKGWSDFKEAYNKAFRTNIGLKRKNYMTKNNLQKTPSVPEFLELKGLLDDGIRIADKLLSMVK